MIKINSDLHTHTVFSHGKNTPEENVKAAIEKGLDKIAITDHAPSHLFYGIRKLSAYIEAINRLKEKYAGEIEVLSGIELNITSLNGVLVEKKEFLDRLDLMLIAYHKAVLYKDFKSAYHFYITGRKDKKDVIALNTKSYINALENNRIDILAHPGYALLLDHGLIASYCAQKGVLIEINNAHCGLLLEKLAVYKNAGVKFVITSDAHNMNEVGVFNKAVETALKAGLTADDIVNAY